jgi:hypothetical protein
MYEDKTISFWRFYHLLQDSDKLNLKIEEDWLWIYKDLEFLLDNDDTADLSLNDVA